MAGVCEPAAVHEDYYHPVEWRKRTDFGTATFGDMGCHIFDPVFGAFSLPRRSPCARKDLRPQKHNWAINAKIHYVFPGTPFTEGKTVAITWYDGDERPPKDIQALVGPAPCQGQAPSSWGRKEQCFYPMSRRRLCFPRSNSEASRCRRRKV